MTTAAKAAALGGYRSGLPLAGQAAAAAARKASRLPPATVSAVAPAAEEGLAVPLLSSEKGQSDAPAVQAIQRQSWEIDDWEFAGGEEELLDSLRPAPRLVFGPVPTLEEAKDATADLKDAVERVYFSPSTEVSLNGVLGSASPENVALVKSMPNHVIQAFSLLQGSPEAQDVVASLASDKNIWDAVMKNEKVMEFYKMHWSPVHSEESVAENECTKEPLVNPKTPAEDSQTSVFAAMVHNIKVKVTEMVSHISNFLQDLLGNSREAQSSTSTKSTGTSGTVDVAVGASFIALAIAAILVVLVKRG